MEPTWLQIHPETPRGRSESAPEMSRKMSPRSTPKGNQKGPQIAPQIDKKNGESLRSTIGKSKSLLEFESEAQSDEHDPKELPHGAQNPRKINKGSAA